MSSATFATPPCGAADGSATRRARPSSPSASTSRAFIAALRSVAQVCGAAAPPPLDELLRSPEPLPPPPSPLAALVDASSPPLPPPPSLPPLMAAPVETPVAAPVEAPGGRSRRFASKVRSAASRSVSKWTLSSRRRGGGLRCGGGEASLAASAGAAALVDGGGGVNCHGFSCGVERRETSSTARKTSCSVMLSCVPSSPAHEKQSASSHTGSQHVVRELGAHL